MKKLTLYIVSMFIVTVPCGCGDKNDSKVIEDSDTKNVQLESLHQEESISKNVSELDDVDVWVRGDANFCDIHKLKLSIVDGSVPSLETMISPNMRYLEFADSVESDLPHFKSWFFSEDEISSGSGRVKAKAKYCFKCQNELNARWKLFNALSEEEQLKYYKNK